MVAILPGSLRLQWLGVHKSLAGPRRCIGRRVDQAKQSVIHMQERQGKSRHVQCGKEGTCPGTFNRDTLGLQLRKRRTGDDGQLHGRRGSEAVHEKDDTIPANKGPISIHRS